MNTKKLCFILPLLPFLTGAVQDEEVHSNLDTKFTFISDSNVANITEKYGYFLEGEMPTMTKGKENSWSLTTRFVRSTTKKIQIRLYYLYGPTANWHHLASDSGCSYYEVYRSAYVSGKIGSYLQCVIPLKSALENHGLKTDYRYKIFQATFALGVYVDEHSGSNKGEFAYVHLPSTYNTGKRYHLDVSKYATSSYRLMNYDYNQEEAHRKVTFGGKNWQVKMDAIADGKFLDWRDFQKESRGEIKAFTFPIPLKMELRQFGTSERRNLLINDADMNLFIYDGYERYNLGETSIGYEGKKGYKIPLRQRFDGEYVTLDIKDIYWVSLDGRRVYNRDTVPDGGRGYQQVRSGFPIPSIPDKSEYKFLFQMELLNVGALGLVDITGKFSYTKSKNYFGSHKNSSYYVEEEL